MKKHSTKIELNQFEHQIDANILEKALTLQKQLTQNGIEQPEKGKYQFSFTGNPIIHAVAKLNSTEMFDWECSCNYSKGPVCIHVTALLLEIIEQKESPVKPVKTQSKKTQSKKKTPKAQVKEILSMLSKEDLDIYLIQLMEEEPKLRMKFISQLGSTVGISAKEKLTNHFGALLSEVPKKKGGLEGKALKKLLEELKAFDFQIETLIQKEKWEEALQLCIDLFEIFCPYLRFVKEEDLRLVNFLVALQKKITPVFNEALPITLGQDSFNYFKLLTSEKQKNNPHFKVGVLLFLATIAREENEIESVLEIFDDLKGYYRIVGVNIMQRKREFILEKKGKPAFLKYCLSHQDRDENQKAAILFLIDEKEFEQAEQIALQGQKRNQGYYYEADFSILLLKIYQLTNQNLKGITLAKSLFYLSSGRLEYFLFLKSFYDEKTWSEIRGKIILDLRKLRGGEIFSNLRKIYKVEEMWPELLEFFKKSVLLSELLSFTPKLMVSNAKETMTLWFKELKYSFNYFYYDSDRDKVASFLRGLKFRIAENEFEFLIQKLILEFSNRENIVAFLKASLLWKPEPEDSEKSDDDGLEFDEEEDDFDLDDDEAFFD